MTRHLLVAMCLAVLILPGAAAADIPSTASFSSTVSAVCQPGDVCTYEDFEANASGDYFGTLRIVSNRTSGEKSHVRVTTRFENTFALAGGTKTIGYEAIYGFTGVIRAHGLDGTGSCMAKYPGQGYTVLSSVFAVDSDLRTGTPSFIVFSGGGWVFSQTFNARGLNGNELPMYIELSCGVEVAPGSTAELTLEGGPNSSLQECRRSGLKHLHLTDVDTPSCPFTDD